MAWSEEQEGFPSEPSDPVVELCPQCHSACERTGAQAFAAGPHCWMKTFYWRCRACDYEWAPCPYEQCHAIAVPDIFEVRESTDGPVIVQYWRCLINHHRWHQLVENALPPESVTVDTILGTPMSEIAEDISREE